MPRLSDRAFYILKHEIENQSQAGLDPVEQFILTARPAPLKLLKAMAGRPL
ncbi:hypothetical protein BH23CYA1_BH23CYA1_00950 [soil metagenome]|uniref:hypothetical protein n=1 Tax=Leptolyngbya sp. BC1307 TaxID=2029589 RepID=UPI001482EC62|nr:hypothetical protein [Leptolyngbya sp. BC1307]